VLGAALGCEGHVDGDVLLTFGHLVEADVVNQAEINDIDWNLRILTLLKCVEYVVLGDGHI
jgi:hypothetical protein